MFEGRPDVNWIRPVSRKADGFGKSAVVENAALKAAFIGDAMGTSC